MPVLSNARHELFAQERAQGRTVDEAHQLAGFKPNRGNAGRLNANESVQARVAELQRAAADKVELTVSGVLMELWRVASADPRELIEYRVGCCRHCWGEGFRYQETPRQREARYAIWLKDGQAAVDTERAADFLEFDEKGGLGFDARRAPNAHCPECFGDGEGRPVLKDTRTLSASARALYAGVKVTKDGFEVKTHDKGQALARVGQHLGMFVDRRINTDVGLEDFLAQLDAGGGAAGAGEPEAS